MSAADLAHGSVPPSWHLTNSPDAQDYPAAAVAPTGDIWLVYLEMQHHPDHNQIRAPFITAPKDFSRLSEPPKGRFRGPAHPSSLRLRLALKSSLIHDLYL